MEASVTPVPHFPSSETNRDALWLGLLERIARGDSQGIAALYDASSRLVYSLALRILGDSGDAEEVTMDVYLQVWRSATHFNRERGNAAAWLLTIARSRAIDRLRQRTSRTKNEAPLTPEAWVEAPDPGPEESASSSQRRVRILTVMRSLPDEQREALELAYFSGLTHSEMAERLGQPLGTVKTRVRLAMMRMRSLLADIQ